MDPRDFEEQFGAKWVNAGGSVWHAFTREYNGAPASGEMACRSSWVRTYNRTPMAWTLNHRVGDIFETFDELVLVNTDTEHALDELWRTIRPPPGRLVVLRRCFGTEPRNAAAL